MPPCGLPVKAGVLQCKNCGFDFPAVAAAPAYAGGQSQTLPPPSAVPAGWYPDPQGSGQLRYWNGMEWTADTSSTSS